MGYVWRTSQHKRPQNFSNESTGVQFPDDSCAMKRYNIEEMNEGEKVCGMFE